MTQPIRIQLSRRKGFRLADAAGNGLPTVKVDRTTKWGNPYAVRLDEMRPNGQFDDDYNPVLQGPWLCQYSDGRIGGWWFPTKIQALKQSVSLFGWMLEQGSPSRFAELRRRLPELRGKNLACWCPIGSPCHADVLLRIANEGEFPA